MPLTIAIPGLIWPDVGDIEYLYQNIKVPFLEQLLKHAKITKLNYSYSDFLCNIHSNESFLDSRNQTLSHKLAQQLNVTHEFPYFLIAEPTHLRIDRDRLLISEASLLQLDETEAHAIINLINLHFAPEFKLYYINEHLWLLGLNINPENEKFYPILDIIGENINDYLPSQKNSLQYNKFLNELQMLLFNSEINKIRKTEGSLNVSGIWIWDKSILNSNTNCHPSASCNPSLNKDNPFTYQEVFINANPLLLNCDKIQALPADLEPLLDTNSLIVIDKLYYPAAYRDSYAWLQQLENMDQQVFKLLNNLKEFRILILGSNQTLELRIKKRFFLKLLLRNKLFLYIIKFIPAGLGNNVKLSSKNNLINLARIWHAS